MNKNDNKLKLVESVSINYTKLKYTFLLKLVLRYQDKMHYAVSIIFGLFLACILYTRLVMIISYKC